MKSLFDPSLANTFLDDKLAMRVYTSQLLGREKDLVLHGGGNTSVKIDGVLYVKGSGWNLDTIEKPGFSPVRLDVLIEMANREHLSDSQMVKEQREALLDPKAPNPSIEAILHAIIPYDFVDHTHADAVVTLTNTPKGIQLIQELYGPHMLIVDYVMPGFELAKYIYHLTKDIDWSVLDGIILLNHGVFTFDHDAAVSYQKMIDIVTKAEEYLEANTTLPDPSDTVVPNPSMLEEFYAYVSKLRGAPIAPRLIETTAAKALSFLDHLETVIMKGELTPEHVIRIKPFPAILEHDSKGAIDQFVQNYQNYFNAYSKSHHLCLDLAPRYAIIKGYGAVALGKDDKESSIIADIVEHTAGAILRAEQLGGWVSLSPAKMFEMEYWELEQAKLKK